MKRVTLFCEQVKPLTFAPRSGGWAGADLLDQAHDFGKEDATEGRDQRGAAYFALGSQAWHAYNEGYAAGCIAVKLLTGKARPYWLPGRVSWNSGQAVRNV